MNERECEACIKRKTMYCPNSSECFDTDDRPHWEDRITLLEKYSKLQNNWNELKKYIEEWLIKNETWYSNSLSIHDKNYYRKDYLLRKANLTEIKNKMQELEQGKDE